MEEELTEIDFISPCPVDQCRNKNKSYRWIHNQCGGRLKLDDKGWLRCLKCCLTGPFGGKFDCGDHDYKEYSTQGIVHALTVMAHQAVEKSQQRFIAKTTPAILKQLWDEEYEGETKYKGGYEKGKRGINLDGEESNESPFQKVEEPPEED